MVLSVWLAVVAWGKWDRDNALQDIRADVSRLAYALGQHVQRTLTEADRLTSLIGGMVIEQGPNLPLEAWLGTNETHSPAFLQLAVIDRDGVLRSSTSPGFEPIDLSDREHYRVHVDRPVPRLFISKPVVGRISGRWSIQLSKGIVDQAGRFAGVVVLSLDPEYLTNLYRSVYLGKHGQINLVGVHDRVIRASWSGSESQPGQVIPADSPLGHAIADPAAPMVGETSPVDHITRIFGLRRIPTRDLVIVVGYDIDEALQNYRERLFVVICMATAISALIVFFQMRQARVLQRLKAVADHEAAMKDSLEEKRRQLHALFLAMPDGVALLGRDNRIIEANTALCDMMGVSLTQLKGATPASFSGWLYRGREPAARACSARTLLAQMSQPTQGREFAALIEFEGPVSPAYEIRIVSAGRGNGMAIVLRDVTDQLQHDRMKSHFVSMAAHELRSPVASIAGYAELLATGVVPTDKRTDIYQGIQSRARHLDLLLTDLLDLARIEMRSAGEMAREPVDLNAFVRETLSREFPDNARIRLDACQSAPIVLADKPLLARALCNLVENALKYSAPEREVRVWLDRQATGQATVAVSDQGIGMNQEEAERAFDRFYRANRNGVAGTGLGLAIVREIVALHQGQIVLATEAGRGTTVSLSLPTIG